MELTVDLIEKRFKVYQMMSYLYLNIPSKKSINTIKDNADFFYELNSEDVSFISEDKIDKYVQEYYDVFFVTTSGLFVPPYESAVANMKVKDGKTNYGSVYSNETIHVKASYESVGFKVENLQGFAPLMINHYDDHIAFELSFLTYLTNLEYKNFEKGLYDEAEKWRKLQYNFLEEHLGKWIGKYNEMIQSKEETLYSHITNWVKEWIDMDIEYLNEEVS